MSPGAVVSEAENRVFADRLQEYNDWILENQSLKARIRAEDVADLVLFLASELAHDHRPKHSASTGVGDGGACDGWVGCGKGVLPFGWGRRAGLLPERGASMARYDLIDNEVRHPLFEPTPFGQGEQARDLASILLVPWSNRIGRGGFADDGGFVDLAPNLMGEPYRYMAMGFSNHGQLSGRRPPRRPCR